MMFLNNYQWTNQLGYKKDILFYFFKKPYEIKSVYSRKIPSLLILLAVDNERYIRVKCFVILMQTMIYH